MEGKEGKNFKGSKEKQGNKKDAKRHQLNQRKWTSLVKSIKSSVGLKPERNSLKAEVGKGN